MATIDDDDIREMASEMGYDDDKIAKLDTSEVRRQAMRFMAEMDELPAGCDPNSSIQCTRAAVRTLMTS